MAREIDIKVRAKQLTLTVNNTGSTVSKPTVASTRATSSSGNVTASVKASTQKASVSTASPIQARVESQNPSAADNHPRTVNIEIDGYGPKSSREYFAKYFNSALSSDAVTSDTFEILANFIKLFSEEASVGDTFAFDISRLLADGYTASDIVNMAYAAVRSVADSFRSIDGGIVFTLDKQMNDTSKIAEAVTFAINKAVFDELMVTDTLSYFLEKHYNDTFSASDVFVAAYKAALTKLDAVSMIDSFVAVMKYKSSPLDSYSLSDDVLLETNFAQTPVDTYYTQDGEIVFEMSRMIEDTAQAIDLLDRVLDVVREFGDDASASDSFAQFTDFERSVYDTLSADDNFDQATGYVRALNSTVTPIDSIAFNLLIEFLDSLSTSDIFDRTIDIIRDNLEIVSLSDSLDFVGDYLREFSDTVLITHPLEIATGDYFAEDYAAEDYNGQTFYL